LPLQASARRTLDPIRSTEFESIRAARAFIPPAHESEHLTGLRLEAQIPHGHQLAESLGYAYKFQLVHLRL